MYPDDTLDRLALRALECFCEQHLEELEDTHLALFPPRVQTHPQYVRRVELADDFRLPLVDTQVPYLTRCLAQATAMLRTSDARSERLWMRLEDVESRADSLDLALERLTLQHQQQLVELHVQHQHELAVLQAEHQQQLADRDQQHQQELDERDQQIADREEWIGDRDEEIAALVHQIDGLQDELDDALELVAVWQPHPHAAPPQAPAAGQLQAGPVIVELPDDAHSEAVSDDIAHPGDADEVDESEDEGSVTPSVELSDADVVTTTALTLVSGKDAVVVLVTPEDWPSLQQRLGVGGLEFGRVLRYRASLREELEE